MTSPSTAPPSDDVRDGPERAPGRQASLTGRAAILFVVLSALLLSLALPVREYVRQRGEIGALQAEKAERETRVAELEARLEQWKDPAFVQAQARQRLQYVMPGEIGYVVLDAESAKSTAETERPREGAANQPSAWYSRLWGSVQKADGAAQ